MSRNSRGRRQGHDAGSVGINPFPRTTPAGNGNLAQQPARSPSPHPRVRSRKVKPTKALTRLEGAAARSRTRTPGEADDEFEANTQAAIASAAAQISDRKAEQLLDAEPTSEQAYDFAVLLRSGVPQLDALSYVLGNVEPGLLELALPRWMRSRATVDALAALNGGKWPVLDPDARLDVALDKHNAELAHFLYTHDFETAEGRDLAKINIARESLEKIRQGRLEQNSPFVKFLRTLLAPKSDTPTLALPEARSTGERPSMLGFVDIEPVVDAQVTETAEQE